MLIQFEYINSVVRSGISEFVIGTVCLKTMFSQTRLSGLTGQPFDLRTGWFMNPEELGTVKLGQRCLLLCVFFSWVLSIMQHCSV